jgi:hypothetical protein
MRLPLRMNRNRLRSSLGFRCARSIRLIYACRPRRLLQRKQGDDRFISRIGQRDPRMILRQQGRNSTSRRRKLSSVTTGEPQRVVQHEDRALPGTPSYTRGNPHVPVQLAFA